MRIPTPPHTKPVLLSLVAVAAIALGRADADAPLHSRRPVATSYPGPGWRGASPTTPRTFRGITPDALGHVRVPGSRSGSHAGRIHSLRLGAGAVFTPETPFDPGER